MDASNDRSPSNVDKHHVLDDEVFSYRATKQGKVFIAWHGKQAMVLDGRAAQDFLAKVEGLDHHQTQLLMARITGNFRRGNERR